ncbi:TetR family transcriptional regulator [Paenibacillus macquariensis subsp. defensor]|nr:TetR family transcriptional regulator [Paenibacillus macquariensis subsp. defensor]
MSPRNVERDQQMREIRKDHILDAALQAMAKRGIDSVSIKDIAIEAQLSIGNVYNYFNSKDEILGEVLSRGQIEYGKMITSYSMLDIDPRDKLTEICTIWLKTSINWAFTIMLESIRTNETVNPEIREAATRRFTENLKPIAEIMQQGQTANVIIDGDTMQLALYFVSLIQGLTLQMAPGYEIPIRIEPENIIRLFYGKK